MKKFIILLIMTIILITVYIIFNICFGWHIELSSNIEVNIPILSKLEYKDTHGGFHGDGETFIKVSLSGKQAEKVIDEIKNNKHWKRLPMSETMNKNSKSPFNSNMSIPEVNNGYCFFVDMHSDVNDKYNENEMYAEERFSKNYAVAVYDIDRNILYYYQYDS